MTAWWLQAGKFSASGSPAGGHIDVFVVDEGEGEGEGEGDVLSPKDAWSIVGASFLPYLAAAPAFPRFEFTSLL